MKSKNIRRRVFLLIIPLLLAVFGISYSFFIYYGKGNNHVAIASSLYLKMEHDDSINLTGMYPMTDEDGMKNGIKYNFNINGYNTTDKNIDYGVYIIEGDEKKDKMKLRYTDIKVYLEERVNGEKTGAYGPINLADFNKNLIYANSVVAKTSKENQINIDYTLTMWIDEKVLISDAETEVFGRSVYTSDEFKNSYASLKVKVEGLTNGANLPLAIETGGVDENNRTYFMVKVMNYNNENEIGMLSNDNIRLEINSDNENIVFSYKDNEGNVTEEKNPSLDLHYLFTEKKAVEIQVFYSLESSYNPISNINLRLTKNGELLQNIVKRLTVM